MRKFRLGQHRALCLPVFVAQGLLPAETRNIVGGEAAQQHAVRCGVVRVVLKACPLEPLHEQRFAGGQGFVAGWRERVAPQRQRLALAYAAVAQLQAVRAPVFPEFGAIAWPVVAK